MDGKSKTNHSFGDGAISRKSVKHLFIEDAPLEIGSCSVNAIFIKLSVCFNSLFLLLNSSPSYIIISDTIIHLNAGMKL